MNLHRLGLDRDGSKLEVKLLQMDPRRPREGKWTVLWTLIIKTGSKGMPILVAMEPKAQTDRVLQVTYGP